MFVGYYDFVYVDLDRICVETALSGIRDKHARRLKWVRRRDNRKNAGESSPLFTPTLASEVPKMLLKTIKKVHPSLQILLLSYTCQS